MEEMVFDMIKALREFSSMIQEFSMALEIDGIYETRVGKIHDEFLSALANGSNVVEDREFDIFYDTLLELIDPASEWADWDEAVYEFIAEYYPGI